MPIYEYTCKFCGKHTEAIQSISEESLVDCPACGKPGLHRMVSAPTFQLKGQGWYVTDFRDKNEGSTDTAKTANNKSAGKEE